MRLFVTFVFFVSLFLASESQGNETGTIYRAKRGPDSYFKSIQYKKNLLMSYADLWSEHFDLPSHVIKGQIEQESSWDNNIVSYKGARGLMQVMPATAYCQDHFCLKMGRDESLHNPYTNIYYGCMYMRMMLDYYDQDLDLALMAYYGGMGRVNKIVKGKMKSKKLKEEIKDYAASVINKSVKYKEIEDFSEELAEN